jgi:hypothetical protein
MQRGIMGGFADIGGEAHGQWDGHQVDFILRDSAICDYSDRVLGLFLDLHRHANQFSDIVGPDALH